MDARRRVLGYEYEYHFTVDEELFPRYSCGLKPGCKSKFILFEMRTSFIIRTIDGVDEPIGSETLDAQLQDSEDESMTVVINMKLSCRMEEYWMTEVEIDRFDREAVDFLRKAEAEDPSRSEIPVLVTVEVRTVQQKGESVSSVMDRAIRADRLIPYFLNTGFSTAAAAHCNMPDAFLTIYVMELSRYRVEDVDQGLEMMEACGVCLRAPTIGAQITMLSACGHAFHSHCIARHLLVKNDIKTKLCPCCQAVGYHPYMDF